MPFCCPCYYQMEDTKVKQKVVVFHGDAACSEGDTMIFWGEMIEDE